MNKMKDLFYPFLLVAYIVYATVFKVTIPDALAIGVLGALNAWKMWLDYNKKIDISEDIIQRLEECESTVNSMSLTDVRGLNNVRKNKDKFVW